MDALVARLGRATVATAVLFVVLLVASTIYTATGDTARDLLIQELLVNLVIVMGLQVFIGSTGILSFGHLAFAQIAAYGAALVTIPAASKASSLPDLPFGLGDVELGAVGGTIVGVIVATAIGAVVGVAVARAGGLAATMITLAVLFVVDQAVKNWTELTRGAGGLSGVPRIETNTWLWVAALGAILAATVFRETRSGRFAVATRDDEIAAGAIGIDRFWPRWTAWVLSVAIVGLAGTLRVQAVGSTNPKQYTLDVAVLVLAMLVAGGMRTVSGAFVGTIVVTVGTEVFRQVGDAQEIERLPDLFLSLVLLGVMLLRPGGLLGDADIAGWRRERARRRHPNPIGGSSAPQGGAKPSGDVKPSDAVGVAGAGGDLEAAGITVRFGGFVALDDAGVRVRPGEVVGLIGPNGAGKTTLFNVVTGIVAEEAGTVTLGDRDLTSEPPHRIARAGLARTFQNLRLFGTLSVHENGAHAALSGAHYRPDAPAFDVDV
ncbi:MAG: ABC transporter permease subunit, partial [Ilumatobacteraceae bacterium]